MKKLQNRKGFTLVELLIVMAIIGILLLVAVPRFSKSTESATVRTAQGNVRSLVSAAQTYYADKNEWPTDVAALVSNGYVSSETYGTDGSTNAKPKNTTYSVDGDNMKAIVTQISNAPNIDEITYDSGQKQVTITIAFK